jgi:hypothetical protein
MKKLLFFFLFISLSALSFAQEIPVSSFAKNKMVIDGNAGEWNLPLKHYDNATRLFFDFENDANHLYLCFQAKDELNEEKILQAGMKIILSSKINGKHKSVINYPLPAPKTENSDEITLDPMAPKANTHATFLAKDSLIEVKGFATQNGTISSKDTMGIHAAINWDSSKSLIYEIAIPLKELFGENYDVKDFSKDIAIEVVINAVPYGNFPKLNRTQSSSGNDESNEERQLRAKRAFMLQKAQFKEKFTLARP